MRRNEQNVIDLFISKLGLSEQTATIVVGRMDEESLHAIIWEHDAVKVLETLTDPLPVLNFVDPKRCPGKSMNIEQFPEDLILG